MQALEMVICPVCGNPYPKKRLEMGYKTCVNCSTEKPVSAIVEGIPGGGEDTLSMIHIVQQEDALAIAQAKAQLRGARVAALDAVVELDMNTLERDEEVSSSIEDSFKKDSQLEEIEKDLKDTYTEGTLDELFEVKSELERFGESDFEDGFQEEEPEDEYDDEDKFN